jgi:hypothetical protein
VTGGDGGFRLARLPPGDWVVRASLKPPHDGFALEAAETCVLPGAHDLVLRLDRSREIHGHITGPGGTPPPKKLNVVMRGVRPDGGNGDVWSGTVAADGTFVIRHVGSGANMLWAWTTDAASNLALTILHDVPPGTRDLQVTLKTGGVIEGSLVDACGEPVKGGGWLYAYDGDVLVNGANLPKAGSFRSYLLPRDRVYDVTLLSASGWTGTVRGVAAGTSGLVVQGRRLPPLTGIVLLPDGSRAGAGVQVQAKAVGISADRRPGTAVHVSTDAQGRFSIPKLADFRYVVTARATSDYAPARAPGTVRPGDEVQLDLRPAERLSGRVIRANSLPAAKSTVWVVPEDAAFAGWPMKTDDDGRFALETLPAGRVRLMVDTLDGAVEVGRATVPAEEVVLTLPDR